MVVRRYVRRGFDFVFAKIVGDWHEEQTLNWTADNHRSYFGRSIAVSYALFALRIPPTVNGVKEALFLAV